MSQQSKIFWPNMLRFAFRRGPGVRSFTAEAATKPKLTVSERVKGDKQGLVGVAASTLAFILSAQSFRMRNERDEAIERAEAAAEDSVGHKD